MLADATLATEWIVVSAQVFRADCDIVLDTIADPEAQAETGLRISKPYYRTGVALAVPRSSAIASFAGLNDRTKVGVQVGSFAAMVLSQQHVRTSTFGFEKGMLAALAADEIDAAAVTPLSAGYYNLMHPSQPFTILPPDESGGRPRVNEAVGICQPDYKLREAIDGALDRLRADGIIEKIYAKYGISLSPHARCRPVCESLRGRGAGPISRLGGDGIFRDQVLWRRRALFDQSHGLDADCVIRRSPICGTGAARRDHLFERIDD